MSLQQLSLFEFPDEDKPLPEIIAAGGKDWRGFSLQYHDIEDTRYYAVQDWIRGVALTDNPARFWTDLQRRIEQTHEIQLYAPCVQLPYRANNNKTYQMDFASAETLYSITQYMDSMTGIRVKVLRYLARAGVKLDEMRRDPAKALQVGIDGYRKSGKDDTWITDRIQGKVSRNELTAALHKAVLAGVDYVKATDTEYRGMFGKTARQIKAAHGQKNARDGMTREALALLSAAESTMARLIGDREHLTFQEALDVIEDVAAMYRVSVERVQAALGLDLSTGLPLLKG